MSTRKITSILISLVLATGIAVAKARPLPPPDPERGSIGMTVRVIPPAKIGKFAATRVYFVRLEGDGYELKGESVIPSDYSRKKQVYLLNARPGRFVAVAAEWEVRDNTNFEVKEYRAFFSEEMIRQTELFVVPGRIVFMGHYLVNTSTRIADADAVQSHYLELISPESERPGFVERIFLESGGSYNYTATLKELSNDPVTEAEFWRVARKKVFKKQPVWKEFLENQSDTPPQMEAKSNPLGELAGDWDLKGFVVGGADSFSVYRCGKVTVASPTDEAVSISGSCGDAGDYSFRLEGGSDRQAFLFTVQSQYGISVDDFPVSYVAGQGWHGEGDRLVDGETLSITARVAPIEGRNWYGWTIEVLPTVALDQDPEEITRPYFKADLTGRK